MEEKSSLSFLIVFGLLFLKSSVEKEWCRLEGRGVGVVGERERERTCGRVWLFYRVREGN